MTIYKINQVKDLVDCIGISHDDTTKPKRGAKNAIGGANIQFGFKDGGILVLALSIRCKEDGTLHSSS